MLVSIEIDNEVLSDAVSAAKRQGIDTGAFIQNALVRQIEHEKRSEVFEKIVADIRNSPEGTVLDIAALIDKHTENLSLKKRTLLVRVVAYTNGKKITRAVPSSKSLIVRL